MRASLKHAVAAVSVVAAGCAATGGTPSGQYGYTIDGRNSVVVDPYSLCWRTGFWTPAMAIPECDPDLAPKPKPKPAAPPPPAPAAPAPAPVAPPAPAPVAPPPAPKPAAAAPAPRRCDASVTLDSDSLFSFNTATLSNPARARIDKDVLGRLGQCATVDVVVVTGHTDRLGSQEFNQKLSERRAAAVKQYLAQKGVPADKIETIGMGKTAPAKFCPDSRNRKELIDCLAPNRRVSIDIKGPAK